MKARIVVTPKKTVLDPQGKAVEQAIHHLGMTAVKNTRIGKFIEMEIEGNAADLEKTRARLDRVCKDLLSNPVIEDYHLELEK